MFKFVDETTKRLKLQYKTGRIEYRGHHLIPTDILLDVIPNDAELIFYSLDYGLQSTKPDSKEELDKSPYSSLILSASYKLHKMIADDATEYLNHKKNRDGMSVSQKPTIKVPTNVVKSLEKNLQNKPENKEKEKKKDESKKPNDSNNDKNKNNNSSSKNKQKPKSESQSDEENNQGIKYIFIIYLYKLFSILV